MRWLQRSQTVRPTARGSGAEVTWNGDNAAVHDSPALAEIFAALDPDQPVRVLDLGPAIQANLDYYSTIGSGVRIVPLVRDDGLEGLQQLDADAFAAKLNRLLPVGGDGFGLVLMWDLLNYLDDEQPSLLAHHLAAVALDSARIHAMIFTGETMPPGPSRYELLQAGRLRYRPASHGRTGAPNPPAARVERWLEPFRVERSFVLRHGIREFIAILPEPAERRFFGRAFTLGSGASSR
jgi:hypothetical protein